MKTIYAIVFFIALRFSSYALTANVLVDKVEIIDNNTTSINNGYSTQENPLISTKTFNDDSIAKLGNTNDTSLVNKSLPQDTVSKLSFGHKLVTIVLSASASAFSGYSVGIWIGSYGAIGWAAGGVIGGICGGIVGIIIANSINHDSEAHIQKQDNK